MSLSVVGRSLTVVTIRWTKESSEDESDGGPFVAVSMKVEEALTDTGTIVTLKISINEEPSPMVGSQRREVDTEIIESVTTRHTRHEETDTRQISKRLRPLPFTVTFGW